MKTRKLSKTKLIRLAERLAFLLTASLSLTESLVIIRDQTDSSKERQLLDELLSHVKNGRTFSESLAVLRIFDRLSVNIIMVGEMTGTLNTNVAFVRNNLQKSVEMRNKILNALSYPAIVIATTATLCLFLIEVIFPKIRPLFSSLRVPLPLSTKILLALSTIPTSIWIPIVILVATLPVIITVGWKSWPRSRIALEKLILFLPVFGKVFKKYVLATIFRIVSLLLKSGVSLADTLIISQKISPSLSYSKSLEGAAQKIRGGETLSQALEANQKLFPKDALGLIIVGETTGNLSEVCARLAEMYENDLDILIKRLSGLVEPTLMIILGLIVGLVALSIISPIYEITQSIK